LNTQPHKVLVIGPAWVGDMVMAQALFKAIKQRYADAIIDVVAPAWSRALLERMPEVRQAIMLPIEHGELQFKKRWSLARRLRLEKYNQAITLPNSWKSALIPLLAEIPMRTGWRGEMRFGLLNDIRYLDKNKFPLMVQRFIALALNKHESFSIESFKPALHISPETQAVTLAKFRLNPLQAPVLALCPGAEYGPAKRWPAEYFVEVAQQKLAAGWQVWLFGSSKDETIATEIESSTQQACFNLVGKTSLAEAIDLLSLANCVVSNDSGLMHIAAGLQRPMVAIYGSSSPSFTPPLAQQVQMLKIDLPCAPCFQRECPLGHLKCLKELTPRLVLEAISQLSY